MKCFKDRLKIILKDIDKVEHVDIISECVQSRLDQSLMNYYDNLIDTCDYLISKSPLKALKYLTARFKEGDN